LLASIPCVARRQKGRDLRPYIDMGQLMRDIRENAGMLQEDVSRAMGKSQSFMSRVESGQRRVDVVELRRFCRIVGIKMTEFVRLFERHVK
jgi:transcriptional regulator with XRE-family HTH domain